MNIVGNLWGSCMTTPIRHKITWIFEKSSHLAPLLLKQLVFALDNKKEPNVTCDLWGNKLSNRGCIFHEI